MVQIHVALALAAKEGLEDMVPAAAVVMGPGALATFPPIQTYSIALETAHQRFSLIALDPAVPPSRASTALALTTRPALSLFFPNALATALRLSGQSAVEHV